MNETITMRTVWAKPMIRRVFEGKYANFVKDARVSLQAVVDVIATAHDFDFTVDTATESVVVNQVEYTLEGNDTDCRDVINVRFGDGGSDDPVLDRKDYLEQDRRLGTGETESPDMSSYIVYGASEDGFPKITLNANPTDASKILTYRYRKSKITISNIPDEFKMVTIDGLTSMFIPAFAAAFDVSLNNMVMRHKVGGDDYSTVRRDPKIESGNVRRNGLYGET